MHVCIVINARLPAFLYGGTERVVVWLGRALVGMGHRVSYLCAAGSQLDFAACLTLDPKAPLDAQLPEGVDIVHMHTELPAPQSVPSCLTIHGNTREPRSFPANTIFCSARHAATHNASAFVHLGLDPLEYGPPPALDRPGESFLFLGKAAWKLKNLKGAQSIARRAGAPLEVLGGTRLNFKMGFRFSLDTNARFHGMVGGERKNEFLRRGRALLFPVLWDEPGATAVIESLYFGLPVFGTPYGCLPELVPAQAGTLSEQEAVLVEAARQVQALDRRAIHQWWSEGFTSRHMAAKYLGYYTQILDGSPLHPGPIASPVTRHPHLYPWVPA